MTDENNKVVKVIDLKQKRNVVKANDLVEARYRLNAVEQKIVILLLSEIDFEDNDFCEYFISTTNLMDILGIHGGGGDYRFISNTVDSLMSRVLHIPLEDGDWFKSHWVSNARYESKKGGITFKLDEDLKPYLLKLKKVFTKYDRMQVINLNSSYSIRFYEFMMKYRRLGSFRVNLEDLKKTLGVTGKSYNKYSNFKNRILEPARIELEEKTDVRFSYTERKIRKRVVGLDFSIFPNKAKEIETKAGDTSSMFPDEKEEPSIVGKLIRSGLKERDAWDIWTKKFEYVDVAFRQEIVDKGIEFEKYIDEKLAIVEQKKNQGGIRQSVQGFIISAIRNNYISPKAEEAEKRKLQAEKRKSVDDLQERKREISERSDDETRAIIEAILIEEPGILEKAFENLMKDEQKGLQAIYKSKLTAVENYKSRIVQGVIDGEIKRQFPGKFEKIDQKFQDEIKEVDKRLEEVRKK